LKVPEFSESKKYRRIFIRYRKWIFNKWNCQKLNFHVFVYPINYY
jgi:hypothetical protein